MEGVGAERDHSGQLVKLQVAVACTLISICSPLLWCSAFTTSGACHCPAATLLASQQQAHQKGSAPAAHPCKRHVANPVGQYSFVTPCMTVSTLPCRGKILKYLRQIAVITPYSEFTFQYKAEEDKNSVNATFRRRTTKMPGPPEVHLLSGARCPCHVCQCGGRTLHHKCQGCNVMPAAVAR